jgi:ankyrin repeat protein
MRKEFVMPTKQLPSRPSLDHLKHQAKDLLEARHAGTPEATQRIKGSHPEFAKATEEEIRAAKFALSDAQLVIAREYGFESWPKLKVHVEALARGDDPAIAAFLQAASGGNQMEANRLLAEMPSLAQANIYTAAMLGEADVVESLLKKEPALATRKGGPKDWDALLYLSHSRFHRENEKRAEGIVRAAKSLLAHGADPNTFYPTPEYGRESRMRALWAATCQANNPAVARILLEAGADPNDSESIYHAAEKFHLECLELLAEFGVNLSNRVQPWNNTPLYYILGHRPTKSNAKQVFEGARWLLEHGADPNVSSYEYEGRPIHLAASGGWGTDMLDLLWKHGADLTVRRKDVESAQVAASHVLRPDTVGLSRGSAYSLAARYGQTHAMDWLREHGAQTDLTPTEEFFVACGRGDESAVHAILAARPELVSSLSEEDKLVLAFAAGDGKVEAVRLMLLAGMPMTIRGDTGGTPLHQAAWYGQLEVVKLLLAHHAPLEEKDTTYGGTPLGWACHGSMNCRNPNGDYPAIVEALIRAGAEILSGHSGTEEVNAVLRR